MKRKLILKQKPKRRLIIKKKPPINRDLSKRRRYA